MKYIKEFKIFENHEMSNWDEVKDAINVLEDELDFNFFESNNLLRTWSDLISFKFKSNKTLHQLNEDDKRLISWFIDKILDIKYIILEKNVIDVLSYLERNEEGNFDLYQLGKYKIVASSFNFKEKEYTYIFNFKIKHISFSEYAIRNNDSDILNKIGPDIITKELFHSYCRELYSFDFSIFSVFRNVENKLLKPVKKRDIRLPHNLSEQFIIDITPIFLEKVFNASGLIFRLKISKYDESGVTRSDRLRGHSIAQETDEKLKELGLVDMTWKDIFIIEN